MALDFLIITALAHERDACLVRLESWRELTIAGYVVRCGTLGTFTVAVALADRMGNVCAATVATALISELRPSNVLLVGIAGGIRKAPARPHFRDARSLGDVLIAEQVFGYESAKVARSGAEPRPFAYPAAAQLLRAARELRNEEWNASLNVMRPAQAIEARASSAVFGPVLSGEKVVANAAFLDEVRQICPAAIGIEMEGFGVASACHQSSPPVAFLLIKAICDFADEHKDDDWQCYAADVAAAFAVSLIRRLAALPTVIDGAAFTPLQHVAQAPSVPLADAQMRPIATRRPANGGAQRSADVQDHAAPRLDPESIFLPPVSDHTGTVTEVTVPGSGEPPPLPTPHIPRSTTFPMLAR